MIEIGIHHNGGADLPVRRTESGDALCDGTLADMHASVQRVLAAQVCQGVLAEQLGFDGFSMTEHHFQPEGAEFSPNPLLTQSAIAAGNSRIRLGQTTNLITQWHPLRIAELGAMLDVISGGRVDFGIGRGYQPREVNVFGAALGSTIQDQERNRAYFEEAYEIILKAWTEPSFSHRGDFFSIPPSYALWHHAVTVSHFAQPGVGRSVEQVLDLDRSPGPPVGIPVMGKPSTLREISVFPQPIQGPYPPVWQPVTSTRSVEWAARNGVNGQLIPQVASRTRKLIDAYYREAERCDWPDRLDDGEFAYGWDGQRRRGLSVAPWIHIVPPGADHGDAVARFDLGLDLSWAYYGPFGFSAAVFEAEEKPDLGLQVTGRMLRDKGMAMVGSAEQVIDGLVTMLRGLGFADACLVCHFEMVGYRGEEIEEQMHLFAETVMPALRKEFSGGPGWAGPEAPAT